MSQKEYSRDYFPEIHEMALFVDLDNFSMTAMQGQEIGALVNALKPWGKVAIRRAYGNNVQTRRYLYPQLIEHRFEVRTVGLEGSPRRNATDIQIAMEAIEMLHTRPGVRIYSIVGGDSDYVGMVERLRQSRCLVLGIGSRRNSSPALQKSCDHFLYYEDMALPVRATAQPPQNEASKRVAVGPESMRTILRHRNLYPPDPALRRRLLQMLASMAQPGRQTFQELQQLLLARATDRGISHRAVRNCMRALVFAGAIVPSEDSPISGRPILPLPPIAEMEEAICKVQLQSLLDAPDLIADPVAMADAVWGNAGRAPEVERLMAALLESPQEKVKFAE